MAMDLQSSGALLRILNLIALADGDCATEEQTLLDALSKQYSLEARMISWLDGMRDPNDISELAKKIQPEHHRLAITTATMVANVARRTGDEHLISPEEDALLTQLSAALSLSAEAITDARQEAEQQLRQQPNLWQILVQCFGSQLQRPAPH